MKKTTRRGSRKKENVDRFALLPDDVVVLILRKVPADELRFRVCYVCRQWSNLINHRILSLMKKTTRRGSRKKENVDRFALLPDDVVVLILRKVPADELRFRVCYVCRQWSNLINHRILVNYFSLIRQNNSGSPRHRVVRITEEEGELAVKEQDLEIPYKGCIKSWVDEYLLISGHSKKGSLYLYNILTKEGRFLPRCSFSCGGHYGRKCGVGFSYDRFKQVYKVVHVFNGPPIQSELIILKHGNFNSSTWKKINGPLYTGQRKYSWHDPVSIDGRYLHWNVNSFDYLLSMDTVQERFRRISLPPVYGDNLKNKNQYSICKIGGFLGLHEVSSENDVIWVLKNFERTTWEKLKFIRVTASVDPDRGILIPPIAPRYSRYLVFIDPYEHDPVYYSYDFKDKLLRRLDIIKR